MRQGCSRNYRRLRGFVQGLSGPARVGARHGAGAALMLAVMAGGPAAGQDAAAVHLNQHGFTPGAAKRAIVVTDSKTPLEWRLETATGRVVARGQTTPFGETPAAGQNVHRADFSGVAAAGEGYSLAAGQARSAPFAIGPRVYERLKYDAFAFFYHQRASIEIEARFVGETWARPSAHDPDLATCAGPKDHRGNRWGGCPYTLDVSRGWYDAGDHGKYVVNGGISVWTLLNYYERISARPGEMAKFADGALQIPENANGVSDLLDEARWQMDFMLAMQVPDGVRLQLPRGDQRRAQKLTFSTVDAGGMAHHKMHDVAWTPLPTPPHLDKEERVLTYPSTAATLNLAASAAQGARLWRGVDDAFADRLLAAARRAYAAAKRTPDALAYDVTDGGGGGYGDGDVSDEFYWAAAELYITTRDAGYGADMRASPHFLAAPKADGTGAGDISWASVATLGTLSLLTAPGALTGAELATAQQRLRAAADAYAAEIEKDGYGVPFQRPYTWGSNADMANRGLILAVAHDLAGERRHRDAVVAIMDYLLGRNPLGQSYVSGYGANPMRHPHHRFWANSLDPSLPPPPPGVLAGGPNKQSPADPVAREINPHCAPQACYRDDVDAYALNEVAINWNAPFFWIAAFLDEDA